MRFPFLTVQCFNVSGATYAGGAVSFGCLGVTGKAVRLPA